MWPLNGGPLNGGPLNEGSTVHLSTKLSEVTARKGFKTQCEDYISDTLVIFTSWL